MPVDALFVKNAVIMATRRTQEHIEDLRQITGLMNPNSTPQLLPWLRERGYRFGDLQKATVQKVITEDEETPGGTLTEDARDALKLRQWAARISTRKFTSVLRALGNDSRIRFLFQFAGASRTARWAGRRVQAQNMPRTPKILEAPKPYESHELLSIVTDVIRSGDYDGLGLYVREPLEAIVGCTRSMFRAPAGYEFVVCDLAAIESVTIAWVSGCERLLQVFLDGRDPYKDFGQTLYRCAYADVTREQRSNSKPAVLGAGYRLGGGELKEGKRTGLWGYAESMGVNMTQAESETAVRVFRQTYPEIPELWYALENAALSCLKLQRPRTVGPIRFEWLKPYLVIVLPSGRRCYYYKPRIHTLQFVSKKTGEPYTKIGISYMGQDQKTGVWTRLFSHGGKWTENIVQAIARDVLAVGMQRAAAAGFQVAGHVHDELITSRKLNDERFSLDKLSRAMTEPMPWAPDLPLNAAGYCSVLYRKD
jgi:DNA polymerase